MDSESGFRGGYRRSHKCLLHFFQEVKMERNIHNREMFTSFN